MHQVFISYSHADAEAASRLVEFLSRHKVAVWQDVLEIRGGDTFDQRIRHAIQNAGFLIALISTRSLGSDYVRAELQYAFELRERGVPLTVVPVIVDDSPIPDLLARSHVLRISEWDDDALRPVLNALRGVHTITILDNQYLRIQALRWGRPFDDRTLNPVTVLVRGTTRQVWIFLIQSVGDNRLTGEATKIVKEIATQFVANLKTIVASITEEIG